MPTRTGARGNRGTTLFPLPKQRTQSPTASSCGVLLIMAEQTRYDYIAAIEQGPGSPFGSGMNFARSAPKVAHTQGDLSLLVPIWVLFPSSPFALFNYEAV